MKEWLKVNLGVAFCFIRNGISIKQLDGKTGIPITRIETIWNGNLDENRFGFGDITEMDLIKYSNYLLENGDILITHINSPKHLGKCAIYSGKPEKLIHGMNLLCLRPDLNKLFPNYAYYYFNSESFKIKIPKITNHSVNQASFSAGSLKQIQIPLPPLETQKKIAAILDKAQELLELEKQIIQKYDQLAQSLFLEMFGDTWVNNKSFPLKKLSETVKEGKIITYGIVQAGPNVEGGVPYIRTGDIKNGEIIIDGLLKTSETIAKAYERSKCSYGDIIMSIRATVGTVALLPKELDGANLTQGTARISPNNNIINRIYLFHCLLSKGIQTQIDIATKGATFREITLGRLRDVLIPVPPIEIQRKFADLIEGINKQKQLAQENLHKSEELFQSLLQRAFKGELV